MVTRREVRPLPGAHRGMTPAPRPRTRSPGGTTTTSPVSSPERAYFGTQMTDRQGGYGDIGADRGIIDSGDSQQIASRVGDIFANRDVGIGTDSESEQERIARISREIVSGERSFGDVRRSVDRLAQNADHTRASAGLPAVTQPQLSPEQIGQLGRARRAAQAGFESTQADALEAKAEANFNAEMQRERFLEQFGQQRRNQMNQAGDVGMAFQPAGAGRATRATNEAEAFEIGDLETRLGFQLSQLAERVAQARRQRDTQLGGLDDQQQEMQSALIREQLANFGGY